MTSSSCRIQIKFPGGKRVDAVLGEQVIQTDQSVAHGGSGSAPEPFDLFLASLATCAGLYVLVFCRHAAFLRIGFRSSKSKSSKTDGCVASG